MNIPTEVIYEIWVYERLGWEFYEYADSERDAKIVVSELTVPSYIATIELPSIPLEQ